MGKDSLFSLLSSHNMLVRKRKRRITIIQSFHWLRKYPNLIRDFVPNTVQENKNLKTERSWKNYYKKNPIIVNQFIGLFIKGTSNNSFASRFSAFFIGKVEKNCNFEP